MARAMMEAVRRYEVNDQHPRALFVLQGKLAMEIACAASDALDRTPAEQIRLARELGAGSAAVQSQARKLLSDAIVENLDVAIVAFENVAGRPGGKYQVLQVLHDMVFPVGDDIRAIFAEWIAYLRDQKLWGG
jgi:hypothetical protein